MEERQCELGLIAGGWRIGQRRQKLKVKKNIEGPVCRFGMQVLFYACFGLKTGSTRWEMGLEDKKTSADYENRLCGPVTLTVPLLDDGIVVSVKTVKRRDGHGTADSQ